MALSANPVTLGTLLAEVEGSQLPGGSASTRVSGVTNDSRRVLAGDLFVAVPGFERDGREFIPEALRRGAVAVAAEVPVDAAVPVLVVEIARRALADLAAA